MMLTTEEKYELFFNAYVKKRNPRAKGINTFQQLLTDVTTWLGYPIQPKQKDVFRDRAHKINIYDTGEEEYEEEEEEYDDRGYYDEPKPEPTYKSETYKTSTRKTFIRYRDKATGRFIKNPFR